MSGTRSLMFDELQIQRLYDFIGSVICQFIAHQRQTFVGQPRNTNSTTLPITGKQPRTHLRAAPGTTKRVCQVCQVRRVFLPRSNSIERRLNFNLSPSEICRNYVDALNDKIITNEFTISLQAVLFLLTLYQPITTTRILIT